MGLMPPTESMFMVPESREQPMHVGSLQLFSMPEGAGPDHLGELYRQSISVEEVAPLFRRRPYRSALTAGQWAWTEDRSLDLEHHIRHSALPQPGRVRELLALVSRLHGTLLDRKRPLWEAHLIEGLEGDRFAVYTKIHHAMMDGVSGLRLLQRSLSTDADARDTPLPWEAQRARAPRERPDGPGLLSQALGLPLAVPKAALQVTSGALGMTPTVLRMAERGLREQATMLPMQAPKSMLNVGITGSRRFAAETWSMERLQRVAKAADATVNDIVLAMSSGALRRYLLDLDALPDAPLVAMTPVSLRRDEADESTGNAVGVLLCNLGTHLAHPEARLHAIHASMQRGKDAFRGLSQTQITAISAATWRRCCPRPWACTASPTRRTTSSSRTCPGRRSRSTGTARGCRGSTRCRSRPRQALNITVASYAGEMQFGLTGCRRSVPRLQVLLTHLEDSLGELETAFAS
jgi:WS/DGAT/MGAT family acyltransferase